MLQDKKFRFIILNDKYSPFKKKLSISCIEKGEITHIADISGDQIEVFVENSGFSREAAGIEILCDEFFEELNNV